MRRQVGHDSLDAWPGGTGPIRPGRVFVENSSAIAGRRPKAALGLI
jgi:hypothetical protein